MFQSFAIVPAAGRSTRMGRPKLLLPWRDGTVVEQVLSAWHASGVQHVLVIVHPEDELLADTCRAAGALLIVAEQPPPDMKASVVLGLQAIRVRFNPADRDAWLLAPADMPDLSPAVIDRLLAAHVPEDPRILVPVHAGRRGHPALFSWTLAARVESLASSDGVNRLFDDHAVQEIFCPAAALAPDVDTPDDYRRLHGRDCSE
ncbi:MAG: nucleotidyltransferase family protein [Pirellulales bacterium]